MKATDQPGGDDGKIDRIGDRLQPLGSGSLENCQPRGGRGAHEES